MVTYRITYDSKGQTSSVSAQADADRGMLLAKQAVEAYSRGDLDHALQPSLACGTESGDLQNIRGILLKRKGLLAEAIAAYERALFLNPGLTIARCNLGIALRQIGQIDLAIAHWQAITVSDPAFTDPYVLLALARIDRSELEQAEALLLRALSVDSQCVPALVNLALVFHLKGRLDEAIECYRRALRIDPAASDIQINLGAVFHEKRMAAEARECFERAFATAPGSSTVQYNLAQELLLMGDFERGWRLHESRFAWLKEQGAVQHAFEQPRWHGEDPRDRTVLLCAEQGLGDTLQFVRYAPLLAQRGARVIVQCQPQLVRLLRTMEGVDEVVPAGQAAPHFDSFCPLMSLPLAFGTTLQSIPSNVPYIRANQDLLDMWRRRLGETDDLRVGLVWAGSPAVARIDRRRSFPFSTYAPLFDIPGVQFHSLQKQASLTEREGDDPHRLQLADFPTDCHDFFDDSAYVENLDLVISVDTSTAHLAGAMGKPVWLLCKYDGCWRWLLDRADTPWYPTMRIFRQDAAGDWQSVIHKVALALRAYSADKRGLKSLPG